MLDRTPFLPFIGRRLSALSERVEEQVWRVDPESLPVTRTTPTSAHAPVADADSMSFEPVPEVPFFWGDLFDQSFFRVDLRGRETAGRHLLWGDLGEATAFVDGRPVFGFDPAHTHQPVPAGVDELLIESICCRTGIWVPGATQGLDERGSRFEGAFLAERNEAAWSLWLDLDVLLNLAAVLIQRTHPHAAPFGKGGFRERLDTIPPLAKRILVGLDAAADAFDRGDTAGAGEQTAVLLASLADGADDSVKLLLTGHAHIDLVWLWPERVGDFKAVHSLANGLALAEKYDEVVMGYSQPASYDAVAKRAPKLLDRLKSAAAAGHFEHAGASYVEFDTQIATGEALIRCIELGQADQERLFGTVSEVLWLPDTFGYTGCLPTIMRACGVKSFYTTKQAWSEGTQFPFSSFRWRGHDGSEVVTHVSFTHYNQEAKPEQLTFFAENHRQGGVHDEALLPIGYGDGGGGPTEAMAERARRCATLAGLPQSGWGRIDGFFERLHERAEALPAHRGEIYLECHRGVQTTHGNLKDAFRDAERALQSWEAAAACTNGEGPPTRAWKRLAFAQFHDHIPGTSIQEVYDGAVPELEKLGADGREGARRLLEAAGSGRDAHPCLFNPLAMPVDAAHEGRVLRLPALAGVAVADAEEVSGAAEAGEAFLRNDRVEVSFNGLGEIESMVADGVELAVDGSVGQIWSFPDRPVLYPAWDIDRATVSNGQHEDGAAEASVGNASGAIALVTFRRTLSDGSPAAVTWSLAAGATAVRVSVELDWKTPHRLLKLVCPTKYHGRTARFGAPFGSTLRSQWPGTIAEDAAFETPASRWAAVSDDTEAEGLALITASRYGFGAREGCLHASLLRSVTVTRPNTGGQVNDLESATTEAAVSDLGPVTIELALAPFRADAPRAEQPAALAESLFTGPVAYRGRPFASAFVGIDGGGSLVPAWVRPGEKPGEARVRVHETLGRRGRVTLGGADLAFAPYSLHQVDISLSPVA